MLPFFLGLNIFCFFFKSTKSANKPFVLGNPGAYSFNYDISDDRTGNSQYRTEERFPNGTVSGAYGYVDAFGAPQRFRYIADQAGYR